jgi:hypothetical protein
MSAVSGIPNMAWINRNVPVLEVARTLQLEIADQGRIRCWHPDHHENRDRTASVGIRKVNNTVKCFGNGCGVGPFGPIDFVKDVLSLRSPHEAAIWIAERFVVPYLRPRAHLPKRPVPIQPAGFEGEIGILIGSGLWADLRESTRCIAPALLFLGTREPGKPKWLVKASFRTIGRYSGIRSPSAISRALTELQEIAWLEKATGQSASVGRAGLVRETNTYVINPESNELVDLAQARAKQIREEIEAEKQMRKEARTKRSRMHRDPPRDQPTATLIT